MTRTVLYDVARLLNRAKAPNPTGIDRVDIRYLQHFRADTGTDVVGVVQKKGCLVRVPDAIMERLWALLAPRWIDGAGAPAQDLREGKWLKIRSSFRSGVIRLTARKRIDPALWPLRDGRTEIVYVNTSHNGIKDAALFDSLRDNLGARVVFYLHDTIPIDFPQYVRTGFDRRHIQRVGLMARKGDLILTNSRYSRDRFLAFCAGLGIAPPPVTVLHIGVEPAFLDRVANARSPGRTDRHYFVSVGTIEPRKNLGLLLDVWKILRARGGKLPELRLIGRRGWVTEANRDFDTKLAELAEDVVELPSVGDADLVRQIAGARALLFPSFVEGWGMPLVEAQVIGTPAIASAIDAFAEAGQGLALLLPADAPEAWADAVQRFAESGSTARSDAAARLSAFAPPTWAAHFDGAEAALRALAPTTEETAAV